MRFSPLTDRSRSATRAGVGRGVPGIACLALVLVLVGCATPPPARPRPPPPMEAPAPPPPSPQVYFYPQRGQNAQQQDRDRYECYLWAKRQTGFDPSDPQLPPHRRVTVLPLPAPGHDTAVGATAGAVIGAAVSRPRDALGGAVLGAVVGGVAGAASDSARQAQAARIEDRYDRQSAAEAAREEQQVLEYRRAMSACLEGRGYTVQ
jgi:hypothetical protein